MDRGNCMMSIAVDTLQEASNLKDAGIDAGHADAIASAMFRACLSG